MWLNIEDFGRKFIWECFKQYFQNNWILVGIFGLYVLSVLFLLIKGNKREKNIFVYPAFVYLITVFNPWVADTFIRVFAVSIRYYRYFWMLPIPFLMIYLFIRVLEKCHKMVRILIGVVVLLGCIFGYSKTNGVHAMPTNVYKINQDVLEASYIITEDKDKEENVGLYDYWFYYDLRSFDASIRPFITRDQFTELMVTQVTGDMIGEAQNAQDYQSLIKYVFASGQQADVEVLRTAVAESDIDYIILHMSAESAYNQFLSAGCEMVGATEQFYILRCHPKEELRG